MAIPVFPRTMLPSSSTWPAMPGALMSFGHSGKGQLRATTQVGREWTEVYPLMKPTDLTVRAWLAAIVSYQRSAKVFWVDHRSMRTLLGAGGGTPLVNGAAQLGASIITDGWTAGATALRAGDVIRFTGSPVVHDVLTDVVANGSGQATISVEPPVYQSPADNAVIVYNSTTGRVKFRACVTELVVPRAEADELYGGVSITFREMPGADDAEEGAVLATLPPAQQAALVWAFDAAFGQSGQTHTARIGPTATRGSTAGADTNDPTHVATSPAHYTYDADDYLDVGDVLQATWQNGSGFTILIAIAPGAADLSATRAILCKDSALTAREWMLYETSGVVNFVTAYGSNENNRTDFATAAILTAARQTIAVTYNPALARTSRAVIFRNGSSVSTTGTAVGADGTLADTVAPLTVGGRPHSTYGFLTAIAAIGDVYVWNGVLTPAEIAENHTWLVNRGWV